MVEVFKGQDAVVLSLGFQAEHRHSALVHASVKAGVKRLVASGYGANDNNTEVQKMFPIAARKAQMVEELKMLEKPGWSWTAICCGLFFDLYAPTALKKATDVDEWTVSHVDTDDQIRTGAEEWQTTGSMKGMGKLALASNLKEAYGADFKRQGLLDNKMLGLQHENLDEVVARVVDQGR
ncbi:hypothetical protein MMC18_002855 [Xylographa bjoerkii]|nr:hypothetical protein [Xylographa bjoerkii]